MATDQTGPLTPQPDIMNIAPYVPGEHGLAGHNRVIVLSANENPLGPGDAPCGLVIEQALAVRPLGRLRVVRLCHIQIALHVFAPFHSILHD